MCARKFNAGQISVENQNWAAAGRSLFSKTKRCASKGWIYHKPTIHMDANLAKAVVCILANMNFTHCRTDLSHVPKKPSRLTGHLMNLN